MSQRLTSELCSVKSDHCFLPVVLPLLPTQRSTDLEQSNPALPLSIVPKTRSSWRQLGSFCG